MTNYEDRFLNIWGTCEKCGAQLTSKDAGFVGKKLCSKCRNQSLYLDSVQPGILGINDPAFFQTYCRQCGAPIPLSSSVAQLCGNCIKKMTSVSFQYTPSDAVLRPDAMPNLAVMPNLAGTISTSISGIERGIYNQEYVVPVDPRDEQIAKLKARIDELEQNGAEVNVLKKRLEKLEHETHKLPSEKAPMLSFDNLCYLLETWIPRYVMKYEESYKAELSEYLARYCLDIKGEARGQLVDILVCGKYAIHLKVSPSKNEYNTLIGQVASTLKEFSYVVCVVVATASKQAFDDFAESIRKNFDNSKVKLFPKAR